MRLAIEKYVRLALEDEGSMPDLIDLDGMRAQRSKEDEAFVYLPSRSVRSSNEPLPRTAARYEQDTKNQFVSIRTVF